MNISDCLYQIDKKENHRILLRHCISSQISLLKGHRRVHKGEEIVIKNPEANRTIIGIQEA